jgi:hypothetical protein
MSELEKTTRVVSEYKQPITVEVNRTTRGYTWSIKVNVEDENQALYLIDLLDSELRKRFQFEVKKSKVEEEVVLP